MNYSVLTIVFLTRIGYRILSGTAFLAIVAGIAILIILKVSRRQKINNLISFRVRHNVLGGCMAIEGVSNWANKVYEAMKAAGINSEDKMKTADDITKMAKIAKPFVTNALLELENKGYAKRVARHKAAGYYLLK